MKLWEILKEENIGKTYTFKSSIAVIRRVKIVKHSGDLLALVKTDEGNMSDITNVYNFEKIMNFNFIEEIIASKIEKRIDFTVDLNTINELTKLDNKTLLERTLKLSEECGEVAEATLSYLKTNGSQYKEKQLEDVLEENLDVIMVAISNICQLYNYEPNNKFIQDLFDTKLQKWYNKCCKGNDK